MTTKAKGVPARHPKTNEILARFDAGMPRPKIAAETGVPLRQVRHIIEEENIRRHTAPLIDPASLSLTAQEKLNLAIKQHKQQLDLQFEERVAERVRRDIDEHVLPFYNKRAAQYDAVIKARRGAMSRAMFRKILACLHPDRSMSDNMLKEAFTAFEQLEIVLCNEKEMPSVVNAIPRTREELLKAKAEMAMARKARRGARPAPVATRS